MTSVFLILSLTVTSCLQGSRPTLPEILQEGQTMYQLERCFNAAQYYYYEKLRSGENVRATVHHIITYPVGNSIVFALYDSANVVFLQGEYDTTTGKIANGEATDRPLTPLEDSLVHLRQKVDSISGIVTDTNRYGQQFRSLVYFGAEGEGKGYIYPVQQDVRQLVWGDDYLVSFPNITRPGQVSQLHWQHSKNDCTDTAANGHKHENEDLFTAADYFRLLKAREKVSWQKHTVYRKNSRHQFWTVDMKTMEVSPEIAP